MCLNNTVWCKSELWVIIVRDMESQLYLIVCLLLNVQMIAISIRVIRDPATIAVIASSKLACWALGESVTDTAADVDMLNNPSDMHICSTVP